MNWKHLLYIIPLCLIIGLFLGFLLGFNTSETLIILTNSINKCQTETLTYIYNDDGINKVAIDSYYKDCLNNMTVLK